MRDLTLLQREFLDSGTLVLLPKGAFYFGTRRNTIQLSKVLEQVYSRTGSLSSLKWLVERGNPSLAPNKERAFIPALARTGLSAPITVIENLDRHLFVIERGVS